MFTEALINAGRFFDFQSMGSLRSEIRELLSNIPIDFGGGCSLNKAFLMAGLIRQYDLRITVDIGVYRGRSLFPQALSHRRLTRGIVYGIDPWYASEAREQDNAALKGKIDQFIDKTNFQAIYEQVVTLIDKLQLKNHCVLLRSKSSDAIAFFEENNIYFDLIHIDGNHDSRIVTKDMQLYVPRLRNNGFVILDDVSWESVKSVYKELKAIMPLLAERRDKLNDYAVFWNGTSALGTKTRCLVVKWFETKRA